MAVTTMQMTRDQQRKELRFATLKRHMLMQVAVWLQVFLWKSPKIAYGNQPTIAVPIPITIVLKCFVCFIVAKTETPII